MVARRIFARRYRGLDFFNERRPVALSLLDHFRRNDRGTLRNFLLRFFRVVLLAPVHIALHVYHLDYFNESSPVGLFVGSSHVFRPLNCLNRQLQTIPLFLDGLALLPGYWQGQSTFG